MSVAKFVESRVDHDDLFSTSEYRIWEVYALWCRDHQIRFLDRLGFRREMAKLGFSVVKTASKEAINVYFGTIILPQGGGRRKSRHD